MADFAGLLKKTIDGQTNPTPQLRARVYERARETVERKLAAANISEKVVQEQRQALETAIQAVEDEYLAIETSLLGPILEKKPEDDLKIKPVGSFSASQTVKAEQLSVGTQMPADITQPNAATKIVENTVSIKADTLLNTSKDIVQPAHTVLTKKTISDFDKTAQNTQSRETKQNYLSKSDPFARQTTLTNARKNDAAQDLSSFNKKITPKPQEKSAVTHENIFLHAQKGFGHNQTRGERDSSSQSKDVPLAEPVNMDAILAAETQAAYQRVENEARVAQAIAESASTQTAQAGNAPTGEYDIVSDIFVQAAKRGERKAAKRHALIVASSIVALVLIAGGVIFTAWEFFSNKEDNAIVENQDNVKSDTQSENDQDKITDKFTQRLLPDGSEVDPGPAAPTAAVAEGTSAAQGVENTSVADTPGEAIFYMSRTADQPEKAETGNVQWSLVKEAPNTGGPEETAIRGDVTIPDENVSMRFMLRRNTDVSLPAAYIIEISFNVPDSFKGEAFDKLQELSFKQSEQSIGLSFGGAEGVKEGIASAKIDDNFFYYALSNARPYVDGQLQNIRNLNWIRLVLVDKNGRTDELTFSKGTKGEEIFKRVIDQWQADNDRPTVYDGKNQTGSQ